VARVRELSPNLQVEPLTRRTLRSGVCKGSALRFDRWRGATRP
jgi:hypothetical protein